MQRDKCRALKKWRGKGAEKTNFCWETCLFSPPQKPSEYGWITSLLMVFTLHISFKPFINPCLYFDPPINFFQFDFITHFTDALHSTHSTGLSCTFLLSPVLSSQGFVSALNEDPWSSHSSPETQPILQTSLMPSFLLTFSKSEVPQILLLTKVRH